jgi:hypothetical protein
MPRLPEDWAVDIEREDQPPRHPEQALLDSSVLLGNRKS